MAQVEQLAARSHHISRIAAAALGLAALGAPFAASPACAGNGALVWARDGDSDSLDPQRTTTTLSWEVLP